MKSEPRPEPSLLLSCEHGGQRVPREWAGLFAGRERLLASHRGWDSGSLDVARALARRLDAPLLAATITRLLVDLNRSPHNPAVFSALTRGLPRETRAALLARHHAPHWARMREAIDARPGTVLHLAVHSFTPRWQGRRRDFEVGLLYDPARLPERALALDWQRALRTELGAGCRIRRNAPYRGNADGLTTALRRRYAPARYLGLELELNQAAVSEPRWRARLVAALGRVIGDATAPTRTAPSR